MRNHRRMSRKYRKMPINRQSSRIKRGLRIFSVSLIAVITVVGGFWAFNHFNLLQNSDGKTSSVSSTDMESKDLSAPVFSEQDSAQQSKKKPVSITILGAGDDLIHEGIYNQASRRTKGRGYDFSPVYRRIAPEVRAADIAVVNQETPLAGNVLPLSGYPQFNSPVEIGDALLNTGFDVICHANNHSFDQGEEGVAATLNYWDTKKATVIGIYRSEEDLQDIRIVESKGVRTAYIAVTEQTNGLSLPKNSKYKIILTSETEKIRKLIEKAKKMADVVVVSAHWGNENTYKITDKQRQLAQKMVNWGADIIFGNHPHAVQELTVLTRADGTQCPVIYALGNLVSAQAKGMNMVSGLLTVTMTKNFQTEKTNFTDMKFDPIVTHYGRNYSQITIYPLREYTDELAAQHGVRAQTPEFSLSYIHGIIDSNIPKKYLKND